jgi:hypothetical protein
MLRQLNPMDSHSVMDGHIVTAVAVTPCLPLQTPLWVPFPVISCRGISFNQYFGDFSNFTNAWLRHHLKQGEEQHKGLAMSLDSWRRQRNYIDWALEVSGVQLSGCLRPLGDCHLI